MLFGADVGAENTLHLLPYKALDFSCLFLYHMVAYEAQVCQSLRYTRVLRRILLQYATPCHARFRNRIRSLIARMYRASMQPEI